VEGCCECGDEPSGSCATELVSDEWEGTENTLPLKSTFEESLLEDARLYGLCFPFQLFFFSIQTEFVFTKRQKRMHLAFV
jgi:hypothetical protein